jgi:predicted porin
MNKKLMAVAVAGVLTAPAAFAQSSNVQLYGRANLGVDNYKATGAFTPAKDRESRIGIYDSGSRVGLRGTEELGGGLKAIFQIETGVNVDEGNNDAANGNTNASTGFWASRDSFVGVAGNWGQVTFGRQSIWWANGLNNQHQANYINAELPWANGTGMGRIGFPVARQNSVVAYTSPTFAGINGTLSYSPEAQEQVQTSATATTSIGIAPGTLTGNLPGTGVDSDGRIWGITLRGTWGQFYAQYDYASNQGNTVLPAGTQTEISGHKFGASWGYMPGARVGFVYARVYNNALTAANGLAAPAAGTEVRQDGWHLMWEHTFGQFQALAEYGQTSDIKECGLAGPTDSCANSSSKGFMIGGRYFMSKRTWIYLTYNQVTNKDNQFADYQGGGMSRTVTTAYTAGAFVPAASPAGNTPFGADPKLLALGLFHTF